MVVRREPYRHRVLLLSDLQGQDQDWYGMRLRTSGTVSPMTNVAGASMLAAVREDMAGDPHGWHCARGLLTKNGY